jgi:cytoskeletal protein RodZ
MNTEEMNIPAEAAIGVLLKEGRQRAGLSLQEVAKATCIRRTYLEALEADRFDLLPGEVYVVGFLRLYAEALSLEAAPLLVQVRRRHVPGPVEEPAPASRKRRGNPSLLRWVLLTLIVSVVAGGLLYGAWQAGVMGEKTPAKAAVQEALRTAGGGGDAVKGSMEVSARSALEPVLQFPPVTTAE